MTSKTTKTSKQHIHLDIQVRQITNKLFEITQVKKGSKRIKQVKQIRQVKQVRPLRLVRHVRQVNNISTLTYELVSYLETLDK
jgi:hypothetical protein